MLEKLFSFGYHFYLLLSLEIALNLNDSSNEME